MVLERTYTIPLRSEIMKVPRYKRAKKAVAAVRKFTIKHMKSDDVKIGKYLNLKLWERGIRNPVTKVKVIAIKEDNGTVKVELVGAPKEAPKKVEVKKDEGAKGLLKEKLAGAKEKTESKKEARESADKAKEVIKAEVPKETKPTEKPVEKKVEEKKPAEKVPTAHDLAKKATDSKQ